MRIEDIKPQDIKVEPIIKGGTFGPDVFTGVKITHMPTDTSITEEGTNKAKVIGAAFAKLVYLLTGHDHIATDGDEPEIIALEWRKVGEQCWHVELGDFHAHIHPTVHGEDGYWDALVMRKVIGSFNTKDEAIEAASMALIQEAHPTSVEAPAEPTPVQFEKNVIEVGNILDKIAGGRTVEEAQSDIIKLQTKTITEQAESIKNQQATIQSQKNIIDDLVQMVSIKDSAITQLIGAHTLIVDAESKAKAIHRAISSGKLAQTLTTGESKLDQFLLVASDMDVITFLKSYDPESKLMGEPGLFNRVKSALQGVCNTANKGRMFRLVPVTNNAKELADVGA